VKSLIKQIKMHTTRKESLYNFVFFKNGEKNTTPPTQSKSNKRL